MASKYLTPLTTSYINKKYQLYGIKEDVNMENFLPIKLTNVDISIANALRRIFTSEIPTMAFDIPNVKLLTNSSQYHREVLIERLGFITININNKKKYNF